VPTPSRVRVPGALLEVLRHDARLLVRCHEGQRILHPLAEAPPVGASPAHRVVGGGPCDQGPLLRHYDCRQYANTVMADARPELFLA
jgi:hypothetical protein